MTTKPNLKEHMIQRYSTKAFDPAKAISKQDQETLISLMQLAPSSVNLQPWHMVVATTEEGKARVAKGTEGFFSFNKSKVTDASMVVVFATKLDIDDAHLQRVLEKEDEDGRYSEEEQKLGVDGARKLFTNIHRHDLRDAQHWAEKQTYLNIGTLLLGAATLGIDAVPMEGIDIKAIDEEFGLRERGYSANVVVSLGYRSQEDFNAKLPKSRLNEDEVFTMV